MEIKYTTDKNKTDILIKKVINLLKQKGFETYEERDKGKITILAFDSPYYRTRYTVQVTIEENNEEVSTIKLEIAGEKTPIRNIWLMHMIGAGAILVNQWHKKDEMIRLRKEIWEHIKTMVANINSG